MQQILMQAQNAIYLPRKTLFSQLADDQIRACVERKSRHNFSHSRLDVCEVYASNDVVRDMYAAHGQNSASKLRTSMNAQQWIRDRHASGAMTFHQKADPQFQS